MTKLASGKMLFAYTSFDHTDITYQIYNGTSWNSTQTVSGAFLHTMTFKEMSADSDSNNSAYVAFAANGTAKALKVARWNSDGTFNTIETADSTLSHSLPSITITSDGIIHIFSLNSSKIWETDKINSYWAAPKNPFGTTFTSPNMLTAAISYPAAIWTENSTAPYNLMFGTDRISWSASTGIIEPLYCDPYTNDTSPCATSPTFTWQSVSGNKTTYPHVPFFVIVNPDSGPGKGTAPNCASNNRTPDYNRGISNLTNAGVVVLGYVFSDPIPSHTPHTNLSWVEGNITAWKTCYPNIKGIFLDVMPSFTEDGNQTYYSNITKFIHNNESLAYSFGNPGSDLLRSYQGTVDLMDIYEDYHGDTTPFVAPFTNATLQGTNVNTGQADHWHTLYDKSTYSFLQFNKTNITQKGVQNETVYAGLMYFTDNTGCGTNPVHPASSCNDHNPWNTTTSYVGSLASYLNNVSVLSTIHSKDKSGNEINIPIQIYQSGNLVRNGTTPFTFNETSGWKFNFTSPTICKWVYGSTSSLTHSIIVGPNASITFTATNGTPPC